MGPAHSPHNLFRPGVIAGGSTSMLALDPLSGAEAEILARAFAGIDPWARYPISATALRGYLAGVEPGAPRYAIRSGAMLAGAVGLRLGWLRGPYIQFLGVLPQRQSRAIGTHVLTWICKQCRRGGERNVWVAVSDFNARALSFYERNGFARIATIDALVCDGRDEVLLRKRL